MSAITADILPDEVLAIVLKLLADLPVAFSYRTPPAPISASRVNRRWRIVALSSPELWTNIRISHRSRSCHWAAVFVKRSRSCLLDISINLESYVYRGVRYVAPTYVDKVLRIVGPHIGRWRSLALRAWYAQMQYFCSWTVRSGITHSLLEFAHFSIVEGDHTFSPPFVPSLRLNAGLESDDLTAFRAIRSLDIDYGRTNMFEDLRSSEFRQLFAPSSALTTLVIRNFWPQSYRLSDPIDCSTILSFAVSFIGPFYSYPAYNHAYYNCHGIFEGFESLTNAFTLPNLEHLEILGGFSGSPEEDCLLQVPEDWEAPLFPHLRTLRLESMTFGRRELAFIQSISRNITTLRLVHTTGNYRLLTHPAAWPDLRSLTVEMHAKGVPDPVWLAPFVAKRATLGMHISDVALPPWLRHMDPILTASNAGLAIHSQRHAPSLMDGVYRHGFYFDESNMRAVDFELAEIPEQWEGSDEWNEAAQIELMEEGIELVVKVAREVGRYKGMRRELRREERRSLKFDCGSKDGRIAKNRRYNGEDFWVA
ncbi:hypothetical protein B0H19DRAFT_1348690 [Mycena capillaripes]|nr:hypothetical protein B0H19DRAFT_1348690 [Mycena capillaripes]